MRLVLFGPPGAGKGTQAQLLSEQLAISHISSGDLFRHHLQAGTPLGLRAAEYMNQGVLVPDDVTIDIVLEKVLFLNSQEGFILDGFPRNRRQAEVLQEALDRRSRGLDKVVSIEVPEPELIRRLGGRFICRECQAPYTIPQASWDAAETSPDPDPPKAGKGEPDNTDLRCQRCGGELYQRADDSPEAVRKRIEVYETETVPVLDFYRDKGLVVCLPGVDTIERVNQRVLAALGSQAIQSKVE